MGELLQSKGRLRKALYWGNVGVNSEKMMGPKDILKVEFAGSLVRGGGWVVEE